MTPLHEAVRNNILNEVRLLLEKGAGMNAVDRDGRTPLHHATMYGRTDIVELFYSYASNPQD